MKHLILLLAMAGFLAACSGSTSTDTQQAIQAEKEAIVMDSIANSIDESANALKKEAENVEATVDELLEE